MARWENTVHSIVCDGKGCCEETLQVESEAAATREAKDLDWQEVDGKWYCPECKPPRKRPAKGTR